MRDGGEEMRRRRRSLQVKNLTLTHRKVRRDEGAFEVLPPPPSFHLPPREYLLSAELKRLIHGSAEEHRTGLNEACGVLQGSRHPNTDLLQLLQPLSSPLPATYRSHHQQNI